MSRHVTGIGGLFFRADDHKALAAWYNEHFGINDESHGWIWNQDAGPTVFSPFAQDTDYFAPNQAFMLNFRVDDLDAMLAELQAAGIAVSHEQEMEGVGRFARIHDPEGTPIELWQPPA